MSEKILFVDDETAILDRHKRCLRGEFQIDSAVGDASAFEMLSKNPLCGVIVADMRMPLMDGAQLLSKVSVDYPNMIRIMLTGNSDMVGQYMLEKRFWKGGLRRASVAGTVSDCASQSLLNVVPQIGDILKIEIDLR